MASRSAWLFGLVLLAACGGDSEGTAANGPVKESRAPVVDGIDMSSEIAASGGRYAAPIRVSFHDDNGDVVNRVRLQIPAGDFDKSTVIQGAAAEAKSATVTLDLDAASVPAGTYELVVSVLDQTGLESTPVSRDVTFR